MMQIVYKDVPVPVTKIVERPVVEYRENIIEERVDVIVKKPRVVTKTQQVEKVCRPRGLAVHLPLVVSEAERIAAASAPMCNLVSSVADRVPRHPCPAEEVGAEAKDRVHRRGRHTGCSSPRGEGRDQARGGIPGARFIPRRSRHPREDHRGAPR